MRYTRAELGALLDTRRRNGLGETRGEGAFFEFRIKVTPEVVLAVMDSEIVTAAGVRTRLVSVDVDRDGYLIPAFEPVEVTA